MGLALAPEPERAAPFGVTAGRVDFFASDGEPARRLPAEVRLGTELFAMMLGAHAARAYAPDEVATTVLNKRTVDLRAVVVA